MKALEFESRITDTTRIAVPNEVAQEIPAGASVRVIALLESDEDEVWRQAGIEAFAAAYADEDSVYEELLNGSSSR